MSMYEIILSILEEKGPISIASIHDEMNHRSQDKSILLSHVKQVISRKKDLFSVQDDLVSIQPEKELVSITANLEGYRGPAFKVHVDFIKNRFFFYEWYEGYEPAHRENRTIYIGSVEDFKKDIYRLHIWNWEEDYQPDYLVIDGTSWSIQLKTKGKLYETGGLQAFPKDWNKFCRTIKKLTGVTLC